MKPQWLHREVRSMAERCRPEDDVQRWADGGGHSPSIWKDHAENPLTSIRGAYTLASPQEYEADELDKIMVRHFLDTLAEVALAVAARNSSAKHREME